HAVAFLRVVLLVVRVELLVALQRLAVTTVTHEVGDRHDDGLVHLRRHDDAFPHLARVGSRVVARSGWCGLSHGHSSPPTASAASISRPRSSVSQRAMSFLTCPTRDVLS